MGDVARDVDLRFLVTTAASEARVEPMPLDRVEQGWDLESVPARVRAGFFLETPLVNQRMGGVTLHEHEKQ